MLSTRNWIHFGLIVAAFAVFIPRSAGANYFVLVGRRQASLLFRQRTWTSPSGAAAQRVPLP